MCDEKGNPIAFVISGANTHDVKLLNETLDDIKIYPTVEDILSGVNVCLDAGYTGHEEDLILHGYIPHIRPRGEEKAEKERNPQFKAHRWVVERLHSWLNQFRKLFVRYEKSAESYCGLLEFACAIIVWRNFVHIY